MKVGILRAAEGGPIAPQTQSRDWSSAVDRALFARALIGLTGERQAGCRVKRISPTVQVQEVQNRHTGDSRLVFGGVATCGSGHSCPCCAAKVAQKRGEEVISALESHGRDRVVLVTATLRHARRMRLHGLRRLLSLASGEFFAGRPGGRLRERLGVLGAIRANEQTWGGAAGWHPHRHEVWFLKRPFEDNEELRFELRERWRNCVARAYRRLARSIKRAKECEDTPAVRLRYSQLWGARVLKKRSLPEAIAAWEKEWLTLGTLEGVLPDLEHGFRVDCVDNLATYLTKLGLELTNFGGKAAKEGHHTHWTVYRRAVDRELPTPERKEARRLVSEHFSAMRGSALLVFSRGLRDLLGLGPETRDADVAAERVSPEEDSRLLLEFSGEVWDKNARSKRQAWVAELIHAHSAGRLKPHAPGHIETAMMFEAVEPKERGVIVRPLYWEKWFDPTRFPPKLPRPKVEDDSYTTWLESLNQRDALRSNMEAVGVRYPEEVPW